MGSARIWTVANALMLLMFVFSTVVQFNDPDAPVWIGVYAAAAVLSGLEIRRRAPFWGALALTLIAASWSAYISVRVNGVRIASLFAQWEMKDIHVEEAREMYGLLIVAAWMAAIAVAIRRRARRRRAGGADSA